VMEVAGHRRVRDLAACMHHGIGRLHEEERRFAVGVATHLNGMGRVVSADAKNAPHGKAAAAAGNGERWLLRGEECKFRHCGFLEKMKEGGLGKANFEGRYEAKSIILPISNPCCV
jgi:hypothetical protein